MHASRTAADLVAHTTTTKDVARDGVSAAPGRYV